MLFGTIKCVNHALHCVYDTGKRLEEPGPCVSLKKSESEKQRAARSKCIDRCLDQADLGIELQILNGNYSLLIFYLCYICKHYCYPETLLLMVVNNVKLFMDFFFFIVNQGKTDTPPVECSSRNSYIEQNAPSADADSITSEYNRDKPNSTIDLKVEIHRKNSSESSEEAQQLSKPTVTCINVQDAELVSTQDREPRLRAKIDGINLFFYHQLTN